MGKKKPELSEKEKRALNETPKENPYNKMYMAKEKLERFLGSIDEYVQMKKDSGELLEGDLIVPMNTGKPDKRVNYNSSIYELYELIQNGCVALVRFEGATFYGLPIKIKRQHYPPYR